ncbi:MAG TPA: hypothetical protein VGB90_04955 [Alphaproteobacteria bacterium]|jgi:hypothetical protein
MEDPPNNVIAFPVCEPRIRPEVEAIFDLLRGANEMKLLELATVSMNFVSGNIGKPACDSALTDQGMVNALATAFFALGRILDVGMCMEERHTS